MLWSDPYLVWVWWSWSSSDVGYKDKGSRVFSVWPAQHRFVPFLCTLHFLIFLPEKSIFLLCLLIHWLCLGLPTAFQYAPGQVFLFHSKGISKFEQLSELRPYTGLVSDASHPYEKIWALIDSNINLIKPAMVCMEKNPFLIVEAISPHSNHLEWIKKIASELFFMKLWSFSAVAQAYAYSLLG